MNNKLYVGNLPFSTNEEALKNHFSEFGEVQSVVIITDAHSGRSKGFGFIEMATEEQADNALEKLNGTDFSGRPLRVDKAKPKENTRGSGRGPGGRR